MQWRVIPPGVHRHRMALSKSTEAVEHLRLDGEGATPDHVLRRQPDIETMINGSFFYFAKMEATYNTPLPDGKRVGDGVAACNVRAHSTHAAHDAGRFGYVVQRRSGEPFVLTAREPEPGAKYVLSCSPPLIVAGELVPSPATHAEIAEGRGPPGHLGHLARPNPRSMIGQRADGSIVLAATATPIVHADMQRAMVDLECQIAFGLDGGGSTFLWHDGRTLVQIDPARLVGNTIVVFRE
jgi:hypothetical protein